MIDSTVDGYHTKCGKWHNVGDCPLDDDTKRPKPRTSWQQETKTSKKRNIRKVPI